MTNSEKIWQGVGKEAVELHHAYGLAGPRSEVLTDILHFLKEAINLRVTGNPDVQVREFETLSVEESRRIKELQSRRALSDRTVIIVAFNTATPEAQNALLKVLEEPTEHTHIFLIVPRLEIFLPTVLSRLFTAQYEAGQASSEIQIRVEEFLKAHPGERLLIAKKISDDISDEKLPKSFALEFVNHLEQELWKKEERGSRFFEELALCQKYLGDRSASVKMLLEHLAVALPTIKR